MMTAQVERVYDGYERLADHALMIRAGYHAKKLKAGDLFRRPTGDNSLENKTVDDVKERQQEIIERLSQYEQFQGKLGEEETDG